MNRGKIRLLIIILLIVLTLAIYWQIQNAEFIYLDDNAYVYDNLHVQMGLSIESMKWAFTTMDAGFWHPLTWLSLMLDYHLFGLNPGGFHWTNLLLHIISTVLLFLVLSRMTGSLWRSGFVAALFALHPLHVESVAWIAERKDVLSAVFWMLTMYAYLAYVSYPRLRSYLLLVLIFVLGLMAKPMLVTMPFLFLLLDYWPLNRFRVEIQNNRKIEIIPVGPGNTISRLLMEKVPLIILSIMFSSVTFFTVQKTSAIASFSGLSVFSRIGNALVSYVEYISKMIVPVNLAVFYPHPGMWPLWQVLLCLTVLICITLIVIFYIKKYPYLAVGWFWYLGTLVPVIGLIQVGSHGMADRYTYIPMIGLFIMISWGFFDLAKKLRNGKIIISAAAISILFIMTIITWVQIGYWKNSITLFSHAIEVNDRNYLAHGNLGAVYIDEQDYRQAYYFVSKALQLRPNSAGAHRNLGVILSKTGRADSAIIHFQEAIKINPNYINAIRELADIFVENTRFEEAILLYKRVLTLQSDDPETYNNLGVALARTGKIDAAITEFRKALYLKNDYADAKRNLNIVMQNKSK
jgi:tetratricopeptide (TPR) repeat protein